VIHGQRIGFLRPEKEQDTTLVPPFKGNAILINSVLFSCESQISVQAVAKHSLSVPVCFELQTSLVKCFAAVCNRSVHRAFFPKKQKKNSYEKASRRSWRPRIAGCQKKTKNIAESSRKGREKKAKGEALCRSRQQSRQYNGMVVKACLLTHLKDPYKEKLRDAIRNHVDSYSKSIVKASSGLMHWAREMYEDVTHMETVETIYSLDREADNTQRPEL